MATDIAVIVNPGNFKATRKDPEKMLSNFILRVEYFTNFLTVIGDADDSEKRLTLIDGWTRLNLSMETHREG